MFQETLSAFFDSLAICSCKAQEEIWAPTDCPIR